MENKIPLLGQTLSQLQQIAANLNLPKFNAKQIADWIYKKRVESIDQMSNLSKNARLILNKNYTVGITKPMNVAISKDGTKKYLYKYGDKIYIETAYIPDSDRATLCVSSQAGCKMGCKFCATGKQGFTANLTPNQIINQIVSLPEFEKLTNIVFMGMGEPMDNISNLLSTLEILTSDYGLAMSPRRITVSTVGVNPGLERFLAESECHLALSIHNPFENQRAQMMPIQNAHPLSKILNIIKKYDFRHQRRFSAEYTMMDGYNDTQEHANQLAKILNGIPARVNLIKFNPHPESEIRQSSDDKVLLFQNILKSKGIITTLRASRGQDISAACGLLSTKQLQKDK